MHGAVADLPEGRWEGATIVNGQDIYQLGGSSHVLSASNCKTSPVDTIFKFTLGYKMWSQLPERLKVKRTAFTAVLLKNHIYLIGGYSEDDYVLEVERFDCMEGKSEMRNALLTRLKYLAGCVFKGVIYIFGGIEAGVASDKIYQHDESEDTWTEISKMLQPRCRHMVCESGEKIYILGGGDLTSSKVLKTMEMFDPITRQCTKLSKPMLRGVEMANAVYHEGVIYIVGGWTGEGAKASVMYYSVKDNRWHKINRPKIPKPTVHGNCVLVLLPM